MQANTDLGIKKFSFNGSLLCSRSLDCDSAMDVTQCFSVRTPICWWDPMQTYKDLLKPLEPEVYYNLQSCAFSDRVHTTFQWLSRFVMNAGCFIIGFFLLSSHKTRRWHERSQIRHENETIWIRNMKRKLWIRLFWIRNFWFGETGYPAKLDILPQPWFAFHLVPR